MPQLETVTPSTCFRTNRVSSTPSRVDREAKIIYGAKLMQLGDLNEGDARPWTATEETLSQLMQFGLSSKKGMKARFTHPNMSSDGLGSFLGRWKNFQQTADGVYADLHIADVAFKSPQGDLGNYVMDLAEEDGEAFGVSAAGDIDEKNQQEFARSERGRNGEKWPIKWKSMRAADVVDTPAATRGGMFDLMTPDLRNLPAQATALLSTYFGDAEPEVVRGRINAFLDRYLSNRGENPMAEETPATPEVEAPAETSVTPEVEAPNETATEVPAKPDLSADLAAAERQRCKQIRALVDLAGVPDKFNTFVDNNFSVEQTQAALRDIVSKKNPALSNAPEAPADPESKYKAEFAASTDIQKRMTLERFIAVRRYEDGLEPLVKSI